MKYGVVVCVNTENLGDDIQSYVALRFLPSVDYVLDRERLDTFGLEEGLDEPVAAIMNGWYMYSKFSWPPSHVIHPLWISMHIDSKGYSDIGDRFLDGLGGEYLKRFGPIGARDESTLGILKKKGIESYVSGCMTLTLNPFEGQERGNEIILVDVEQSEEKKIRDMYPNAEIVCLTHRLDEQESCDMPIQERFERVEAQLKRYQRAKCVVTSRLHCALPCLALGTPVLLVYKPEYETRMKTVLPLLHVCTDETLTDCLKSRFDLERPPRNADGYKAIRERIEQTCVDFIEKTKSQTCKQPERFSIKDVFLWQKNLLYHTEFTYRKEINSLTDWVGKLKSGKEYVETQWNEALARLSQRDSEIKELRAWAEKQDKAKQYLEEQREGALADAQKKAEQIEELRKWVEEQDKAKQYLDRKREEALADAQKKAEQIEELRKWVEEQDKAKQYLEEQNKIALADLEEKEGMLHELKIWCDEVTAAKLYLEGQWESEKVTNAQQAEREKELSEKNREMSERIEQLNQSLHESENQAKKYRYKLSLLLEDKGICRIIHKRKYEIGEI